MPADRRSGKRLEVGVPGSLLPGSGHRLLAERYWLTVAYRPEFCGGTPDRLVTIMTPVRT